MKMNDCIFCNESLTESERLSTDAFEKARRLNLPKGVMCEQCYTNQVEELELPLNLSKQSSAQSAAEKLADFLRMFADAQGSLTENVKVVPPKPTEDTIGKSNAWMTVWRFGPHCWGRNLLEGHCMTYRDTGQSFSPEVVGLFASDNWSVGTYKNKDIVFYES